MSVRKAPQELRPVDDDESPEDEDQDSEGSSSGRTTRIKLPGLRTLAIGGGIAAVVAWTVMLLWLVTSLSSLDDSVQALRGEVAEQHIPGEPQADVIATPEPVVVASPAPTPEVEPEPEIVLMFGKPIVTDGADLWDCRDFRTWGQALIVYQANLPADPNFIDFDANGVPCEALQAEG